MSGVKRRKSGVFVSKKRSQSLDNYKPFSQSHTNIESPEVPVNSLQTNQLNVPIEHVTLLDSTETESSEEPVNSSNIDEHVNDVTQVSWREGRRIVELGHLVDQLYCTDCGEYLRLSKISKETRYGYGSLLYIDCTCGFINTVETNKRHRVNNKGPKVFDINTKAALGKQC